MTRLTRIENMIEFSPLDVRNPASKPLDLIPTPHGVSNVQKTIWFLTGVSSNGFFVALSLLTGLHPIARVQPDCVEEKGTRYDIRLGGSSRIIRAAGRIIKPRG
jgi:hypothetical protein